MEAHGAVRNFFFFFFFASTVPDSLGVHLRSTGHYQPIRSGVVFDRANEARVYNKLVSALVNGGVFLTVPVNY